ncbi:MAG: AMIN domain-containing protein [Desulfobulbaceae bacterium]|nr:AMIN domain-containing protein [Desulfobulbaceae bacterium]
MTLSLHARMLLVLVAVATLFLGAGTTQASPTAASSPYRIAGIQGDQTGGAYLLKIKGNSSPTYTTYELFNPLRIVIDIADASAAETLRLPLKPGSGPVSEIRGLPLTDQKPFGLRLEVLLAEDRGYAVERERNDIVVKFAEGEASVPTEKSSVTSPKPDKTAGDNLPGASILQGITVDPETNQTSVYLRADGPIRHYRKAQLKKGADRPDRLYIDIDEIGMADVPQLIKVGTSLGRIRTARRGTGVRIVFDSALKDLFDYRINTQDDGLLVAITGAASPSSPMPALEKEEKTPPPAPKKNVAPAKIPPARDEFGLTGYTQQRITVDFFKIDLHNVFRMLGEISGRNIVVDEAVSGSLTLALSDVPWDFVLDVIVNLKDLQKEERFNTIVISPKSKGFVWPERVTDKLAIRADGSMEALEAITIKKRLETPKGVMEAKTIIQQAQNKYKGGDFAGAFALYENAFAKWPENSQLAKRIAALCLVQLGQNAKAVHYAKAALKIDPQDYDAALQAAIGLANMKKNGAAKEYFDLAASGPQPSSETLTSYAAFNEESESYVACLLLLAKHAELYGDTQETMLAKARIYDKQGDGAKAVKEYRALLLSGYQLPADLERYIKGRLAIADQ